MSAMNIMHDDYVPPVYPKRVHNKIKPAYRLAVENPGRWILVSASSSAKSAASRVSNLRGGYKGNPCVEVARDEANVMIRYTPMSGESSGLEAELRPRYERYERDDDEDGEDDTEIPDPEPGVTAAATAAAEAKFATFLATLPQ